MYNTRPQVGRDAYKLFKFSRTV